MHKPLHLRTLTRPVATLIRWCPQVLKALKSSDISRPSISIDRTKARCVSPPGPAAALLPPTHTTTQQPSERLSKDSQAEGGERAWGRWGDKDLGGEHSIFAQIYYALGEHAHAKTLFRGAERWWTVSFVNEHVSDAGGGFRETVSNISDDLNSERTPLLIPVPNSKAEVGDMRDAWMPSPSCRDMRKYEFLGRLMAAAIQCDENIVVKFPVGPHPPPTTSHHLPYCRPAPCPRTVCAHSMPR